MSKSNKYWWNDFGGFVFAVLGTVGIMCVFLMCGRGKEWIECDDLETQSHRPTKFSVWSGCYVKVESRWIPRDSWRGEQDKP